MIYSDLKPSTQVWSNYGIEVVFDSENYLKEFTKEVKSTQIEGFNQPFEIEENTSDKYNLYTIFHLRKLEDFILVREALKNFCAKYHLTVRDY